MQTLRTLSVERVVALVLVLLALIELYGITRLPLSAEFTLGPGAMPLIYAAGLLLFAGILLLRPDGGKVESESNTAWRRGGLFFVLLVVFAVVIEFAGFLIATASFSFLCLLLVARLGLPRSVIYALVWSVGLFYVFQDVLKVPLEQGWLFS